MTRIACIASLLALLTTTAGAEKPSDFAFGIPLALDGDHAFYRVELPAPVYSGSARTDMGDLRVFNADDAIVPYAYVPHPAPAHERRPALALPLFPLFAERDRSDVSGLSLNITRNPSGTIVSVTTQDSPAAAPEPKLIGYLIDATLLQEPLSALTIVWRENTQGFTTKVRVEASEDLDRWRTVATDAPLLDLQYAGRKLTRNRVELSPVQPKYLRLSWPTSAPPLVLSAVQAELGERVVEPAHEWITATGTAVSGNDNEYEFDLGGAYPIDRIAIDLPEINAVVPAELLARATREQPWRPVASLIAYRLRQDSGEITADPTPVSAAGMRYWLLRIDPKSGGFGRGQPQLRTGWAKQEIVFAARGAGPFVIAYGNPNVGSSALPITTLVPGYQTAKDPLAAAGTARPEASTALGGKAQLRPALDVRRATLWGVLILGVLVLAWMAWRLSKQMQSSSPAGDRGRADSKPS
jgi:hypothetical protein